MQSTYQLLDELRPEELSALEKDIAERGVMVPIEVDENGVILDGHNRVAIAERLGKTYQKIVRKFENEDAKKEHVLKLNLARRHLDPLRWGKAFKKLLDVRGVKRGQGSRNELTSDTVSEVAAEFGVDERTARRRMSQADAYEKLPAKQQAAVDSGEKTVKEAVREQKEKERQARRDDNAAKVAAVSDPVEVVGAAKFATIVIDPPWDWGDEGDQDQLGRARPQYATMSIEDMEDEKKLPIAALADEDCHLYLWITNRSLPKGFRLIEKWGFRYVTCLTWCKPSIGMGNYFRGSTEQVLFAVKGSQPLKRKDVGTWFSAPRGPNGHSSKPTEFYDLVESCSPGPYIDVFSRSSRAGWTQWGADAT